MRTGLNVWEPLTPDGNVLWLKYWWGPGSANALAFRLPDGAWAIVSPPSSAPDQVYEEIRSRGEVRLLIAPNAFHHLGQAAWRACFPGAKSYAPTGAFERLAKQTPDIAYHPIEQLADTLAPARIFIPAGMKTPDLLLHIPYEGGSLWWLGDQFSNNSKADQVFLFRLLSRIIANGPGFWCNPKPELVYVHDRSAWLSSMRAALSENPPTIALCAHGDPVTADAAARTQHALNLVAARSRRGLQKS
jgi:hypothetical protein